MDMIADTVYFIWSLKRSGAHGFEEWLFPHIPGRIEFFNNKQVHNPLVSVTQEKITELKSGCKALHSIMFGFEDQPFFLSQNATKNCDDVLSLAGIKDGVRRLVNVLVLRDPFNLVASRLQTRTAGDSKISPLFVDSHTTTMLWKVHAEEFLGCTNHLPNKIVVNFNQWFGDIEYRKRLSLLFGFEFTDWGKDRVGIRGSSFDGFRYCDRASYMDVLSRWRDYLNNDEFIDTVSDHKLVRLAEQIFGPTPKEIVERLRL